MDLVIKFLLENYVLILVIVLIVLLAIIGYFADKTNFGQGKSKENLEKKLLPDKKILENKTLNSLINPNDENSTNVYKNVTTSSTQVIQPNTNVITNVQIAQPNINTMSNVQLINSNKNEVTDVQTIQLNVDSIMPEEPSLSLSLNNNFINSNEDLKVTKDEINDKLNSLDDQINIILPKKDLINSEILEEIGDLSIDNLEYSDAISTSKFSSDISLPKINFSSKSSNDLWKKY